jgi:hypothetical protein
MNDILNEQGIAEVEKVISGIKEQIVKQVKDAIGDIYVDIHDHISTDTWMNYRQQIRLAMKGDIVKDTLTNEYAKDIREQIFKEHKDELIGMINKDMQRKIQDLERHIETMGRNYLPY